MTSIEIRRATVGDEAVLAAHRVGMFRDMRAIDPSAEATLHQAAARYFRTAIASGEYVAWLAAPVDDLDRPVAGAGLQLRPMLPRPDDGGTAVLEGHEGLVLNVYVEPEWRRRGLARALMQTLMDWTRGHGVVRLVLHASDDGRPLYESIGFAATNEMRFIGPRAPASEP